MKIREIPLAEDLLQTMARTLWSAGPPSGLPDCLVLLPSSRACRTLEHILLDLAGREAGLPALLLPRIMTLTQWCDGAAVRLGIDRSGLPDPRLRPLALAPRMAELPWLRDHPDSAPGLAEEFIALFDEARLEGCADRLLEDCGDPLQQEWVGFGAEAEATAADILRIREVWRLYRKLVGRDEIDALVELAERLAAAPRKPAAWPTLVVAGGFGLLDRVRTRILAAALDSGPEGVCFLPEAEAVDRLDRSFGATWPDPGFSGPFGPTARLRRALAPRATGPEGPGPVSPTGTLRERLEEARGVNGSGDFPAIDLVPCADPEVEARTVVDLVVRHFQAGDGPARPVAVGTPDPRLARRILALLEDAGLPADDTQGRPLATLPAGLLARCMLRAALTDLRAEPLLEVLTHPFVTLPVKHGSYPVWTLRLEKHFRRPDTSAEGLAGLVRRAAERDQVVRDLFPTAEPGMVEFVGLIEDAFAPLLAVARRTSAPWAEHVAACRDSWRALTGGEEATRGRDRPDELALHEIWEVLTAGGQALGPVSLAEFTAMMGRLLAAEMVVPHRVRNLPVMVTGLVEMRLERREHLILAGLREDVFPSPTPRRSLLTPGARARLGLPGWREHVSLDAELMLRLLHNGDRVTVTWPLEEEGRPVLPSPLVERLALALDRAPAPPPGMIPRWRRIPPAQDAIVAAQAAFAADPRPTPALAPSRPQMHLSWTALRQWRDCPYRFLMERGFALSREEEIRAEFGRMDYGSLVHQIMREFLDPNGQGLRLLAAGDVDGARRVLDAAAAGRMSAGSEDLPVRRLWLDTFRRVIPAVVDTELARLERWRPHLLEQEFTAPLAVLVDWARDRCRDLGEADLQPRAGWDAALAAAADIVLCGTLDRLDLSREDPAGAAVVDYKTGRTPSAKAVAQLDELQVVLYAAAVEAGVVGADSGPLTVVEGIYSGLSVDAVGPPARPHLDGTTDEGRALLVRGMVRLIDLALAAAADTVYPVLSEEARAGSSGALPCRYCDLRGVCRIEEERGNPQYPPALWLGLDGIVHGRQGDF